MNEFPDRPASDSRSDLCVVLCTVPDQDTARRLAWLLIDERLAACVNVVTGVTSVYRWQSKIEEDAEILLVVKTSRDRFPAMRERLADAHPYDVPEIVALPVQDVLEPYGAWLLECVTPRRSSS
jgi:periplasmic divalent cation tolerance protein